MANLEMRVGVIGAGVMGEALIAGLISYGVKPSLISIYEKRADRSNELVERYKVKASNLDEVCSADILLLVTKPQDMQALLEEIKGLLGSKTLLVTFAAGKTIKFISEHTGGSNPVVRVMPNTPTLVGKGAAAISLGGGVNSEQRDYVKGFLAATGKVIEVDEVLQDAVTATSGSGPAYFFAFVEAMIAGAKKLGLSEADATTLTIQTIVGSAALLAESGESATVLREKVTSPNGTTAAALASFEGSNLAQIVADAMAAAHKRSQELA
jgi:pyrroline-5-carboxylate reductase